MPLEWRRDGYVISTDPARLDLGAIHEFLSARSYWARGVSMDRVRRSVEHSLPFGLYDSSGAQAGFARVITDYTIFAWLCDVFVLETHRGRGLGVWLVETALAHPQLSDLRQWLLGTEDAHGLYERFGFQQPDDPRRYLRLRRSEEDISAEA
jgi:GNAT superfamily N-acetyltransferase